MKYEEFIEAVGNDAEKQTTERVTVMYNRKGMTFIAGLETSIAKVRYVGHSGNNFITRYVNGHYDEVFAPAMSLVG